MSIHLPGHNRAQARAREPLCPGTGSRQEPRSQILPEGWPRPCLWAKHGTLFLVVLFPGGKPRGLSLGMGQNTSPHLRRKRGVFLDGPPSAGGWGCKVNIRLWAPVKEELKEMHAQVVKIM